MLKQQIAQNISLKISNLLVFGLICLCLIENALASPLYSRQYKISCTACHSSPPQLNIYGMRFRQTNSLPSWESNTTVDTGDENTAIPKVFPFSIHSQMLARLRRANHIEDQSTGEVTHDSGLDSQTPHFIKLISSAPLTEEIGFYFDAALMPGQNQDAFTLNESWLRYRFESEFVASLTVGQFPNSDIIFDQDTRLSIKEHLIYAQSNLGLDRGGRFDIHIFNISLSIGLSNGTDAGSAATANGPGIGREDRLFDNNTRKTLYGYVSRQFSKFKLGVFSQINQQFGVTGVTGQTNTDQLTFQYTTGFDIQAYPSHKINWMAQFMWNKWTGFLKKGQVIQWYGGFIGIDYRATEYISYSLLYNYSNAGDFKDTGTIYEGISANVITTSVSYYFRSNVRGILEISMDFLPADNDDDFVGHETKEDALIIGIDISY